MKKLKLDLGALRVETFEASAGTAREPGTVRANGLAAEQSGVWSCQGFTKCQDTCFCANTSPRPTCEDCSWDICVAGAPDFA